MYVIVGLGNYGAKYDHTRHNAGCDCLNILAQRNGISLNKRRFKALTGEGNIAGKKAVLAFPQTYMNDSGASVAELCAFYKPRPDELIVIYDDVDLPEGAVRVRERGSAGTHNGMRSIVADINSQEFVRVRVGIGRPPEYMELSDYVLGRHPREKWQDMFDAYTRAAMAAEECIGVGAGSAMCKFNTNGTKKESEDRAAN